MTGDGTVRLQAGVATVDIEPSRGGRLSSLAVEGHPLLFSARSVALQWGAYPMVPWAGRIADGRFSFAGRVIELPRNLPPHAAHGIGFTSPWSLVDRGQAEAELALDLTPPWPFGGRVSQRFRLDGAGLTISMTVTAGDEPMPLMVGWHPWFNRHLGTGDGSVVEAELRFAAGSMYEIDERAIPTGRLVDPPPRPWDNCFTGIEEGPVLTWPGLVELRLSSSCDHWVVYDRPGHAICVEPQSEAPDAFNRVPTVLGARDRLEAWFRLAWG